MLTLDEARGIAAQIWLRPNFRRTPLDPIMCDHVANLLVDETTKSIFELANAKADFASLNDQYERLKLEHANLEVKLKAFEKDALTEQLKAAGKKDEAV